MSQNALRKRNAKNSSQKQLHREAEARRQRTLMRRSIRDHIAILAIAAFVSVVVYVSKSHLKSYLLSGFPRPTAAGPPFEVVDIFGKGKGVVALRDILQGELILSEAPLFRVPPKVTHDSPGAIILSLLASLSPSQRDSFYNLSYVRLAEDALPGTPRYNEELALAIFQTNAVAAGGSVGIFPRMARLNHGCSGAFNSVYAWREKEGVIVVHALKPIKKGQELLTTYTDTKRPRDERREFLHSHYGFVCGCSVCSLPKELSQASDRRLARMNELYSRLPAWQSGAISGKEAADISRQIWSTGEEEGYWSGRGRLAADTAWVAAAHSDGDAVQAWSRLAREWYAHEIGSDSELVRETEEIIAHPMRHSEWGTREAEVVGGPDVIYFLAQ